MLMRSVTEASSTLVLHMNTTCRETNMLCFSILRIKSCCSIFIYPLKFSCFPLDTKWLFFKLLTTDLNRTVNMKWLNSPVFRMRTSLLGSVRISGSPLLPLQRYRPPSETTRSLPGSTALTGSAVEECETRLNQSYLQSSESSTEQVSVTLPPAGMVVVEDGVTVALGWSAVQIGPKETN